MLRYACSTSPTAAQPMPTQDFRRPLRRQAVALDARPARALDGGHNRLAGPVITSPPLVIKTRSSPASAAANMACAARCKPTTSTRRAGLEPHRAAQGRAQRRQLEGQLGRTWRRGLTGRLLQCGGRRRFLGHQRPVPGTLRFARPRRRLRKLTNLYTASTLALDADSGKIKWWVQQTPADELDYDGVNELVLADLRDEQRDGLRDDEGRPEQFLLVTNRDRARSSRPRYVPTTWQRN